MTGLFVDMSAFQPTNIDWQAYKAWSATGDGKSRVALRSSYGTGYKDSHFDDFRKAALAAGIDAILYYHYAYPQFNRATDEADWQRAVVGKIRPGDVLILDYEEMVPAATWLWALSWLGRQETNYSGQLPGIYASDSYIRSRIQEPVLAKYPLWLANWQFDPDVRPPCPPPWKHYNWLQYTDRATNIPGVPGIVDADISITGESDVTIPTGWTDTGTILTAPNGVQVVSGFRDTVLASWEQDNWPLWPEAGNPLLGKGTYQLFRKGGLGWTPELGIYTLTLGEWILLGTKK